MFEQLLTQTFYGNTVAAYFNAFVVVLGAIIGGKILYWVCGTIFKKLASKTKTKLDDIIVDMIEEPAVFAIILVGVWYGLSLLVLSDQVWAWISKVYHVLIVLNIAWLITRLFEAVFKEYIAPLAGKTETDLDDQLLPLVRKGIKIMIWGVAIIVALNNAGYNVGALIAGLGIGGLALAMAAKDSVENIFGGFTIFTDQPFKMNERVRVVGYDGFVKEIGLRSTRLRTLDGTLVTIPNSKFAANPVENVSAEPSRKITLNLGLVYTTKPKEMEKAMKILESIAKKHPNVQETVKISFNNFGDFALGILFIYYIKKGKDILQTQTDMNLEILKQFNKNKLDMAFPTETVYMKKG